MSYTFATGADLVRAQTSQPVRFFVGLDLGQTQDYSALVVLEHAPSHPGATPRERDQTFALRHIERFKLNTSYPQIVGEVGELVSRPPLAGVCRIAVDATGVGRAVTDIFRDAGKRSQDRSLGVAPGTVVVPATIAAPISAITITGGDQVTRDGRDTRVPKRDLVGVVQALLQTGRLKIAPDLPLTSVLTAELMNFRATISAAGHDSYAAGLDWRAGAHDDLVLALALAAWDAQHGTTTWARSY
jgi:hypothetical protein